jgi:hypothetical protein
MMVFMNKPVLENEVDRVLSNPENFLMSDSLDGRFDPELLVEKATSKNEIPRRYGQFICDFSFDDIDLSGTLTSFKINKEQTTISVRTDVGEIINLLDGDNSLLSVSCKSFSGEDLLLKEFVNPVETTVVVNVIDDTDYAIVTVSFINVQDI